MRIVGWTKEQDDKLRMYCESDTFIPMSIISEDIGKASRTIYSRIAFLGLERQSYSWTSRQDSIIRELYPDHKIPISVIADKVKRSERAVRGRAVKLRLCRFNNDEIREYIINNYGKGNVTARSIAEKFDRPIDTVYRMALELGRTRKQEFDHITTGQLKIIKEKYAKENTYKLSAELGLPDYTIRKFAAKSGIKKSSRKRKKRTKIRKTHKWTLEQERFIINNHETMTMKEIANTLNIPYNSIRGKITTMGLHTKNLKIYSVGNIRFEYNTDYEKQKKLDYVIMFRNLITEKRIGDVCR